MKILFLLSKTSILLLFLAVIAFGCTYKNALKVYNARYKNINVQLFEKINVSQRGVYYEIDFLDFNNKYTPIVFYNYTGQPSSIKVRYRNIQVDSSEEEIMEVSKLLGKTSDELILLANNIICEFEKANIIAVKGINLSKENFIQFQFAEKKVFLYLPNEELSKSFTEKKLKKVDAHWYYYKAESDLF